MAGRSILCVLVSWWLPEQLQKIKDWVYAGRLTRMGCPERLGYKIAPACRLSVGDPYQSAGFFQCNPTTYHHLK